MKKRENVRVCVPRYLQIGKGSLKELPEIIKILGSIKSLLIVTDKQMVSFGYVKKLQDVLSLQVFTHPMLLMIYKKQLAMDSETFIQSAKKYLEEEDLDLILKFAN